MVVENEFTLNHFLSVKLESEVFRECKRYKTIIHVGGEPFKHCTYLLLKQFSPEDAEDLAEKVSEMVEQIYETSIDQMAEQLDDALHEPSMMSADPERYDFYIAPEEEFRAHCSNLQAWVENGYDTRLLHFALSFPLLKRLAELGDFQAQKIFKEELVARFVEGTNTSRDFLIREKFLTEFLNDEEFWAILPKKALIVKEIRDRLDCDCHLGLSHNIHLRKNRNSLNQLSFSVKDGRVHNLSFYRFSLREAEWEWIFGQICSFTRLKILFITESNIEKIPESIGKLQNLEILALFRNRIKMLPENFGSLTRLKRLSLDENQIENLPDSFCDLNAVEINIRSNRLKYLPKNVSKMTKLKELRLPDNQISEIPKSVLDLRKLEFLYMKGNRLNRLDPIVFALRYRKILFLV